MQQFQDITSFLETIPHGVRLVAVSKTRTPEEIMEAYNEGHRIFGENRVQELMEKRGMLPGDIQWHMVGHLQSNKVKYIAPFIQLIHSIDSAKLLGVVDREAEKNERVIDCLLQVHIAREETKFGFDGQEVRELLQSGDLEKLEHIRITGLMGMATFTGDLDRVREEFAYLKSLFDELRSGLVRHPEHFTELSMGMSGDFRIAIEEGSTMIRIGTLIFGPRACRI
jgi:pyridoxal phosphate enzyme (YggS family)